MCKVPILHNIVRNIKTLLQGRQLLGERRNALQSSIYTVDITRSRARTYRRVCGVVIYLLPVIPITRSCEPGKYKFNNPVIQAVLTS